MAKVQVAYEVIESNTLPPPTFQEIRYATFLLVFDIKMEDFQRKARLVAGDHMTESPPSYVTYASVVLP